MKKRIFPLALVLALCLTLCANAAVLRTKNSFTYSPTVTISGSSAACTLRVSATQSTAKITANIDLHSGSYTSVTGWYKTGTGTLNFSDTHTDSRISKGSARLSYTVTVSGSNGTDTVSGYVDG